MLLNSIIAVAIGLFILWIILSFATIQIQEWINTRLGRRARVVEDAIHEMLANPNLKAQFYEHPLIRGLSAQRMARSQDAPWLYRYPLLRGFTRKKRILPSYIPSENFASALFDIVLTAGTESSLIQQGILNIRDDLLKSREPVPPEVIIELNLLAELAYSAAATEAGTASTRYTLEILKAEVNQFVEHLNLKYPRLRLDDRLRLVLLETMRQVLPEAGRLKDHIDDLLRKQYSRRNKDSGLSRFRRGAAGLSVVSPGLGQTLNALILDAETHTEFEEQSFGLLRKNVEKWYDDTMDRVSGAFKRYSQTLALVIGTYLAVLLNIDMISTTHFLWREVFVREALLANASRFTFPQEEFVASPRQAMQIFRRQFIGLSSPPIGWTIRQTVVPALSDSNCQMFPTEGQSFGIPVFYSNRCISPPDSTDETNLLIKLLGFLFTALATRFGAPFWFGVMQNLVRQR